MLLNPTKNEMLAVAMLHADRNLNSFSKETISETIDSWNAYGDDHYNKRLYRNTAEKLFPTYKAIEALHDQR